MSDRLYKLHRRLERYIPWSILRRLIRPVDVRVPLLLRYGHFDFIVEGVPGLTKWHWPWTWHDRGHSTVFLHWWHGPFGMTIFYARTKYHYERLRRRDVRVYPA